MGSGPKIENGPDDGAPLEPGEMGYTDLGNSRLGERQFTIVPPVGGQGQGRFNKEPNLAEPGHHHTLRPVPRRPVGLESEPEGPAVDAAASQSELLDELKKAATMIQAGPDRSNSIKLENLIGLAQFVERHKSNDRFPRLIDTEKNSGMPPVIPLDQFVRDSVKPGQEQRFAGFQQGARIHVENGEDSNLKAAEVVAILRSLGDSFHEVIAVCDYRTDTSCLYFREQKIEGMENRGAA